MTKIGLREREAFLDIVAADMTSIHSKVIEQIKVIWQESRDEILQERGLDILEARKVEINKTIAELQEELNLIEVEIKAEPLTVHQALEMGGKVDGWGKAKSANFFGIPVESELEYDIVKRIKQKVDTEAPAKYLSDLGRTAMRELTMSGTFEECQEIYNQFYSLDFRKYGVDIPPRLKELQEAKETGTENILGYEVEQKQLSEQKKGC